LEDLHANYEKLISRIHTFTYRNRASDNTAAAPVPEPSSDTPHQSATVAGQRGGGE
ncbi:hypothetical protein COCVIDRAFT_97019, partial [Bipolaris victoriae FI3]